MRIRFAVLLAVAPALAYGQTAAEHVTLGDRDHEALNLASAVKHYEAALAVDSNYSPALLKAALDAVDLGEFDANTARRDTLYKAAEQFARRAVALNPNDATAHFELARAIGRNAQTMGTRDKIKFAGEVHDQAMEALRLNPKHAGALHVMGVWNAEVMRLNGISRMIAKNFLGGKIFGEASWDNAQKYLEQSVALEPNRIVHRLDLGKVYADREDKAKAREEFDWIAKATPTEYNDRHYKEQAAEELKRLE